MASNPPAPAESADAPDFSLFAGGPVIKLIRRAHVSKEGLHLPRPIVVITMIVWLPLLVLSTLEGHLLGSTVALPFLRDVEAHIRFLVALPLLLVAEVLADRRMRPLIRQFLDRHLIPDGAQAQFLAAARSVLRLRDSGLELLLIPFVYGVGILIVWRRFVAVDTPTWYGVPLVDGSAPLTLAGMWYCVVSIPIFQFLLCRWYLRLAIWARFAWQASRIELRLMPAHPDRMGGLGFLPVAVRPFAALAMAHGALLAGFFSNQVLFLKAIPAGFKGEVGAMAVFLLIVIIGPLLFFAPALAKARRRGLDEYGRLAERYVRGFDATWLGDRAPDERLLGSPDIQSLADMANSFQVPRNMRLAPVSKELLFLIMGAMLLPLAPLLLTLVPLEALLSRLLGVLF